MPPTDSDVRTLIDAAKRGGREAQDALFARYRNYLTLLARMSVRRGLRAKFGASDVVQDVFVKAHEGIGGFRGQSEEELVGWLRRILANELGMARRRFVGNQGRDVGRERSLDQMVEKSSQALQRLPAARDTSPSRVAERREVGAFVADALAALKEDDREVIVLRSLEDRDWPDVAKRMGRTVESVRGLWLRACGRLGAIVEARQCNAP